MRSGAREGAEGEAPGVRPVREVREVRPVRYDALVIEGDDATGATDPEIVVLPGLEAVRRRPGMYVGDVHDGSGLHHLLWEVVGNVVDLYLARRVSALRVAIADGAVEIEDDGPGLATATEPAADLEELLRLTTAMHGSPTWDGHPFHTHLTNGFHGVGLAAVNALCEDFEIETRVRDHGYRLRCRRGIPLEAAHRVESTLAAGTRVRFRPDDAIFGALRFDLPQIGARLRELAYLCPALTLTFNGEVFRRPAGLRGWVEERSAGPVFSASRVIRDVEIDLAFGFSSGLAPGESSAGEGSAGEGTISSSIGSGVRSFVGMNPMVGGAHVDGLWQGLHEGLAPQLSKAVLRRRLAPQLFAVLNVGLYHPRFGGPSRDWLENREARRAVKQLVVELLPAWLARVPALAERLRAWLAA